MAVDPITTQPSTWVQYIPHTSLVALAIFLARWGRGWVRQWGNRIKAVERDKATVAELTAYQAVVDRKFSELGAKIERHSDDVATRFAKQDETSADRHNDNVKRFDTFSRDTTERLDKILIETLRQRGIGRSS